MSERKLSDGNIAFIVERTIVERFEIIAKSRDEAEEMSKFSDPYTMTTTIKKIKVVKSKDQTV